MKGIKGLFLTLALIVPIALFLFLKFFGKNEFNVEPLFQGEIPSVSEMCDDVQAPYRITDLVRYQISPNDTLTFIYFGSSKETLNTVSRVKEEFKGQSISFVPELNDSASQVIKSCVYLLNDPMNSVLIDKQGLIRGQYDLNDLDEGDRLIVELKILLKLY